MHSCNWKTSLCLGCLLVQRWNLFEDFDSYYLVANAFTKTCLFTHTHAHD